MTPAFVTWIIHVGLDSFVCDMPRVWQYESFTAWRGSCHIWTNASFLISSMWHDPRDSHAHIMHTWIRHVAYKWVMSHIKKWVFFIRHMTDVIRMHICIRHVTCKWVMSHMNDMYGIVNRSCVTWRDSICRSLLQKSPIKQMIFCKRDHLSYGVATISRLLQIAGLFCKRAL